MCGVCVSVCECCVCIFPIINVYNWWLACWCVRHVLINTLALPIRRSNGGGPVRRPPAHRARGVVPLF